MDLTGYRQRETIEPRTLWVELMVAPPPPAALQRAPTSPPRLLVIVIPIPHPRSPDVFGFSITRLPSARPSITPEPDQTRCVGSPPLPESRATPKLTLTTAALYRRGFVMTKSIGAYAFGHNGRLRRKSHLKGVSREARSPFGRSECQLMEYVS